MMPRMLVVHTGGVGDFICAFPALAALGQSAHLEVAGIPERMALARAAGLAVAVHDLDRTGFSSVFSAPNDRLREFAVRFDSAVIFMEDGDGVIQRNLQAAGIDRVACFPGIPPKNWDTHAAHWYAHCAGVEVRLPFQADFGPAIACADVVIQPGSGGSSKNWPLEHFVRVADRLQDTGHTVSWCYGPAEEARVPRRNTLPPMPLKKLAGVLAGARLFIGNDSGITHLAAAAGCPTLAIFGPTDPSVWAPTGPKVRVLRGAPWPAVDAVYGEAISLLNTGGPAVTGE